MARVDLVESWAISTARKNVREALQAHGEEVILLQMFHSTTDPDAERCSVCFDDVYKQGERFDCPECFGTTFAGGVKAASRMWAMFSDTSNDKKKARRGEYSPDDRNAQLESLPIVQRDDYLIRVRRWTRNHTPVLFGDIYVLGEVKVESLRTGNQYATTENDHFGQEATCHAVGKEHPIHHAIGRVVSTEFSVPRLDGKRR